MIIKGINSREMLKMKEIDHLFKQLKNNEKRIKKQAKRVDKLCQDMDALTMRLLSNKLEK